MSTSRSIDDVARTLLAPLLSLQKPSATGWRLQGWDCEQGIQFTLSQGDGVVLLVELEERNDERECYSQTERFNICVRRQFQERAPLNAEQRAVMAQVTRVIGEREKLLPDVDRLTTSRRNDVREIEVDRLLIPEGAGHYYINPYVGCMIGCDFCYVAHRADFSRKLEGLPQLPWGRYVDVKINARQVLEEEVKRYPPGIVRMSPILTDPYQGLERHYRITRQILEVLLPAGFTPVILTRAARVVDDLELLSQFDKAAVGFSIPTDDDAMRKIFEPGGDPIEERLDALRRCHEAGLLTYGIIQPVLPMNVDNLVERMAPHVMAVRVDRMYEMPRVMHLYEKAGRLDAAEDAFFEKTIGELRNKFKARGVNIDDLDDLAAALGLVESRADPGDGEN